MVMARLHIICGNCGCNEMFSFCVDPTGNCGSDGVEYPSVELLCGNCSTLHSLDSTVPEDDNTYADIRTALATVTAERDELASDIVLHLEAAERAAKANGEEAKAANERAETAEDRAQKMTIALVAANERAERSEARAKVMRSSLESLRTESELCANHGVDLQFVQYVLAKATTALKEATND